MDFSAYYNYFDYFFDFENLSPLFSRISSFSAFLAAAGVIFWLLGAVGIFELSKKLGLKHPWLAFIPPVFPFAVGRAAKKYAKRSGEPSARFGLWLELLWVVKTLLFTAFIGCFLFALYRIGFSAFNTLEVDEAIPREVFRSAIPAIALYFLSLAVAITYKAVYCVAFWRICAIFDRKHATLFLILSVLLGNRILPLFFFVIRAKAPDEALLVAPAQSGREQ